MIAGEVCIMTHQLYIILRSDEKLIASKCCVTCFSFHNFFYEASIKKVRIMERLKLTQIVKIYK